MYYIILVNKAIEVSVIYKFCFIAVIRLSHGSGIGRCFLLGGGWGGLTLVFERPKLVHSSGVRGKAPVWRKIKIKAILLHFEPISTIFFYLSS